MSKRWFDIVLAVVGLALASPMFVLLALVIWLQDRHWPFYVADRTGRQGRAFRMVKFRSMVIHADQTGVDSTAGDDPRITRVGRIVRRWKLDEVPQLLNVLRGDMSLVGPRPNTPRETALYTSAEQPLLSVQPGLTDLASIVFADEGEVLRASSDPELRYNQVIRPWKSRLSLLYVGAPWSPYRDLRLMWLTIVNTIARPRALAACADLVRRLGGDQELAAVALRRAVLRAAPPPGAVAIVQQRAIPEPPGSAGTIQPAS